MKKFLLFFSTIFFCIVLTSFAGKPRVYFAYNNFYSPIDGPYIETYLQFEASSLQFRATKTGDYAATIEILMVLKKNTQIIDFKKYEIMSQVVTDTTQKQFTFIDLQRFTTQIDTLDLDITIKDLGNPGEIINHTERIISNFNKTGLQLSTIQLIERYERAKQPGPLTKSGLDIVPYVDNFYPSAAKKITFYQEIYNSEKTLGAGEGFLVQNYIEIFETNRPLSQYNRFIRETAKPVNVVLGEFDISQLPSGNYNLVVVLKDKFNQELISARVFFQRSNPNFRLGDEDLAGIVISNTFAEKITFPDSLTYFIKALAPISSFAEREFALSLVNTRNLTNMQKYFLRFWEEKNSLQPEQEWKKYYIEMCKADAAFKTRVKRGYETDRGRVYLQYGPPNSLNPSYNEPNAMPYEIWHYYTVNGQRNKRFVFASRDLATNDFDLIHSDAVGELQNNRWELEIHSRAFKGWDVDTETVNPHWGSRSRDYFLEPR